MPFVPTQKTIIILTVGLSIVSAGDDFEMQDNNGSRNRYSQLCRLTERAAFQQHYAASLLVTTDSLGAAMRPLGGARCTVL